MVASSRFDGEARSVKCEEENWLGRKKRDTKEARRVLNLRYFRCTFQRFTAVCVCVCVCEEIGIKKYLLFFNFASRFCNVRCNISFSTSIRVCSTKYFTSRFVYLFILFILYSLTLFNRKSTRIDKVFSIVLFSNYNFIWK